MSNDVGFMLSNENLFWLMKFVTTLTTWLASLTSAGPNHCHKMQLIRKTSRPYE